MGLGGTDTTQGALGAGPQYSWPAIDCDRLCKEVMNSSGTRYLPAPDIQYCHYSIDHYGIE